MSGAGHIQKLGENSFRLHIAAGRDDNGKYRRVSERFSGTYREAQKRLAALQDEVNKGEYVSKHGITLGQFIAKWLPGKMTSISASTRHNYDHMANKIMESPLGSRPLGKITAHEINAMLAPIIERGSNGQAQHIYVMLRHIMRQAVQMGELARSPMQGLPMPRSPRKEIQVLGPADWQKVQAYLTGRKSWWLLPFTLAITSGMRRSEIAALKWSDFQSEQGTIRVVRSVHKVVTERIVPGVPKKQRSKRITVIGEPKTSRSRRVIALNSGTVMMLSERKSEAERLAKLQGRDLNPDTHIFVKADGHVMPPDAYTQAWERTATACSLEGIRFHDLRHSSASLLLAGGVPLPVVSARLGHSSPEFTARVYSHALPGAESEAAEKLARILNTPAPLPFVAAAG